MKKYYKVLEKTWAWDTESATWENLGKIPLPPEPIKKRDLMIDSESWSELLFGLFSQYREFPDWEDVRALYEDADDQAYFDMLEKHYKEGKIKTQPYLAEVKNGTHSETNA